MTWPTVFANLSGGNQPLSLLDTMFAQVAAMIPIPCTETGTNSITLQPVGNAPTLAAYGNYNLFSFVAAATSTGSVSAQFQSLANLPVYKSDGTTQATTGDLQIGRPYMLMYNSTLNSNAGGFYLLRPALFPSGGQPTSQVLTSGTSLTYTTPANCLQLYIRMIGGGGGGAGSSTNGTNGGNTTFGTVTANGGQGGQAIGGGTGGNGGAGAALLRINGGSGNQGIAALLGGSGGAGPFGGAGPPGNSASPNTGSGGGAAIGTGSNPSFGGGCGEYVEFFITNPAATYTYTVGTAGAAGTGGVVGAGAAGIIIVQERYQD